MKRLGFWYSCAFSCIVIQSGHFFRSCSIKRRENRDCQGVVMFIIQQSRSNILASLKQQLSALGITDVSYTENPRDVPIFVGALCPEITDRERSARTIVVTSARFNHGHEVESLAREVKALDPNAWFFIWSITPPRITPRDVDGIIPKQTNRLYFHILHFLALISSTNIESIEVLRERLWWIG